VIVYEHGDVRACGSPLCDYAVLFYENYKDRGVWVHIPNTAEDELRGQRCRAPHPYPEHKHQLGLIESDRTHHHFACRVCTYPFEYSRILVRYQTTGKKVFHSEDRNRP
jgi:hypothetical protein